MLSFAFVCGHSRIIFLLVSASMGWCWVNAADQRVFVLELFVVAKRISKGWPDNASHTTYYTKDKIQRIDSPLLLVLNKRLIIRERHHLCIRHSDINIYSWILNLPICYSLAKVKYWNCWRIKPHEIEEADWVLRHALLNSLRFVWFQIDHILINWYGVLITILRIVMRIKIANNLSVHEISWTNCSIRCILFGSDE